jgi:orotidine-5'-phosphate decarboxylase
MTRHNVGFRDKLISASRRNDTLLCVGLDVDASRVPAELLESTGWIEQFNRGIVEATSDLVCAYKPNLAFYEALGLEGWEGLRRTLAAIPSDIPVIADAKRGDIDSTSEAYASALFAELGFDATTVSPYVGLDGLEPFLRYDGRGVLVLSKTSNPGSGDFQDLAVEWHGKRLPLYEVVARRVVEWNRRRNGECGLVVGATYPNQLKEIRALAPDLPILIPGIGAQSGSLEDAVRLGADARGELAIVNVGRTILYAGKQTDWQDTARREALRTVEAMRQSRLSTSAGTDKRR